MTAKQPDKKLTFEQALERLEEIVKEMEEGHTGLDTMAASFEQGRKLVAFCTGKLNEVEKKIELLVKKDGELVTESFEDSG